MPVYDFRCRDCSKKFSVFLSYDQYDRHETVCPACQSSRIERIIRKVPVTRGDRGRLASMASEENLASLDSDPRSLGRMMRDMKNEVGAQDLPGEFDEVVDRLEKGQSPDEIERDLPELGADNGDSDL